MEDPVGIIALEDEATINGVLYIYRSSRTCIEDPYVIQMKLGGQVVIQKEAFAVESESSIENRDFNPEVKITSVCQWTDRLSAPKMFGRFVAEVRSKPLVLEAVKRVWCF